jgi:hypothetical protein
MKTVVKSPLLSALVFEEIIHKNKGLMVKDKLEPDHANLLLNMSTMYYSNLIEDQRNTYK